MIAEHELLEQTEDHGPRRSVEWECSRLSSLGKSEPLAVLQALQRAGLMELRGFEGSALNAWQA